MAFSVEAVELLDRYGPSLDLARSLSQRAFTEFVYRDDDRTVLPLVERAMSVASEVADVEAMIYALNVKAHLVYSRGDLRGMNLMMESLRLAQRLGDQWLETRALSNIAGMYADVREMDRASDFAQRTGDTAARYEIPSLEFDARVTKAELQLWKGDWAAAENNATESLGANRNVEIVAWRVLASIQSRRGRKEARAAVFRMWSLVAPEHGPTVIDPAAAALAEYVWLSDERDPDILQQLEQVLADGIAIGTPWPSGALAFWAWKLGLLETVPAGTADFYGWIISGDYRKSADFWRERGIPYEEGLALMHGTEAEQIEAIRIFEDLGATAAADKVKRALAGQGVRVPRGRSRSTRTHAAGLTARQAEVLELLAAGRSNLEIANELFVSHRTVENHVSAILMKLDVANRDAAVEAARKQGFLNDG
jgi:ATP/maltotriose-dependent transcriptional regulator MalT